MGTRHLCTNPSHSPSASLLDSLPNPLRSSHQPAPSKTRSPQLPIHRPVPSQGQQKTAKHGRPLLVRAIRDGRHRQLLDKAMPHHDTRSGRRRQDHAAVQDQARRSRDDDPTIGFNVEEFTYKNIAFTAWDISGQSGPRPLWKHCIQNSDAVIFVVDSTDVERIPEAADLLTELFKCDELQGVKLLVLANKQDQPGCMSLHDVREKLRLDTITENPYHIQAMVAVSGEGVFEGLDWLNKALTTGS